MKQFFVHRTQPPGPMKNKTPRGFTAVITPSENTGMVLVGAAFCSPRDNFCRKTGRQIATLSAQVECKKTDVPRWLVAMSSVCAFDNWTTKEEWFYVYKYMMD